MYIITRESPLGNRLYWAEGRCWTHKALDVSYYHTLPDALRVYDQRIQKEVVSILEVYPVR